MKDAQKPDHKSLSNLIGRLKEGRFVIPDFQRDFEWKPWDIQALMRSIFLDYYIGSLLLWKGKAENFEALACEPIYGFEGDGSLEHIVLDGQQRLTAMYYTFVAPDIRLPNRSNRYLYFIRVDKFMAEQYDGAFHYDWTNRTHRLLSDKTAQFERHLFPLAVVGQGGWELPNWVQDYERYWVAQAEKAESESDEQRRDEASHFAKDAKAFGEHLKGITEQYQVSYIELDRDLEIDKVCDIFTQVNSKGIRLDVFDLVNALLKPKGLQLKHMWRRAEPSLDFVETGRMNVYVLMVMSILKQAYCSPKYLYYLLPGQEKSVRDTDGSLRKEVLIPTTKEFEASWDQAVEALGRSINLLQHPQEFGAVSSQYLPYVSILPAFAALQVSARALPSARQLDARRKIHHWYWASIFTNRYSGSVESTTARDFLDVKAWFDDDTAAPTMLNEFHARFRDLELRKETKRGSSVYNGIFNLLVIKGARDWMTGNVPQHGDLDDHHIVPKDWGKTTKGVGSLVDSILNRTPLTADTNRRVIGNRLPNEYLPDLIQENGEPMVRSILESHFISPRAFDLLLRNPFTPEDLDSFLDERQRTLQEAIEDLLIKERLDLAPQLRELDQRVERVEVELRRIVVEGLNNDSLLLPAHVLEKVSQRTATAAKKNPTFESGYYESLSGKLEYCDLREIQDTILNKSLWPSFASRFTSREALAAKFSQLSELRNGIRHSRSVDEITRKEGEAALLWFEQVFGGAV